MAWVCLDYPQCDILVRADKKGLPVGVPAGNKDRKYRLLAHNEFDRLWTVGGVIEGRRVFLRAQAYQWLASKLGMSVDDCHIGNFTKPVCELVIRIVSEKINELKRKANAA